MMHSLKDSSELQECTSLLQQLLPAGGMADYATFDLPEVDNVPEAPLGQSLFTETSSVTSSLPEQTTPSPQEPASQPTSSIEPGHKGDKLEDALLILCQRGGFTSAIIADDQGLALADYNSPVDTEVMAAFATVLGGAIAQARHFLDQHEANNISMDINYTDKAVVRKFTVRDTPFYLFIICPQNIDERNEVELSLDTIINLLNS